VADQTIRDVVLSTEASKAAQRLVQMASAAGGSDNITVLMLKVGQ
jgi:serine/threonine protein phosphatase PrpC